MYGDAFMSAGMKGSMNIFYQSSVGTLTAIPITLETVRSWLDIYRERHILCRATGANPVSPKLFGNYFIREDE